MDHANDGRFVLFLTLKNVQMAVDLESMPQSSQRDPLLERLDRIDSLLDHVEEEVNQRHDEAKNFGEVTCCEPPFFFHSPKTRWAAVDVSRDGKRRYLLSRRQNFTTLDENITKILLEIDGLERSHHGAVCLPTPLHTAFYAIFLLTLCCLQGNDDDPR